MPILLNYKPVWYLNSRKPINPARTKSSNEKLEFYNDEESVYYRFQRSFISNIIVIIRKAKGQQ